jgi:hypothetical protein
MIAALIEGTACASGRTDGPMSDGLQIRSWPRLRRYPFSINRLDDTRSQNGSGRISWHYEQMAPDHSQQREAADALRRLLVAVERGELTVGGPAATAMARRLEGALLALEAITGDPELTPSRAVSNE